MKRSFAPRSSARVGLSLMRFIQPRNKGKEAKKAYSKHDWNSIKQIRFFQKQTASALSSAHPSLSLPSASSSSTFSTSTSSLLSNKSLKSEITIPQKHSLTKQQQFQHLISTKLNRKQAAKIFAKKSKHGQPLLNLHMQSLLQRIERNCAKEQQIKQQQQEARKLAQTAAAQAEQDAIAFPTVHPSRLQNLKSPAQARQPPQTQLQEKQHQAPD